MTSSPPPDAATLARALECLSYWERHPMWGKEGFDVVCGRLPMHLAVLAAALRSAEARVKDLEGENDKLRYFVASGNGDCIYCKLPAADMAKCASGFPGCARADDLLAGMADYSLPTPEPTDA